LTVNYNGASAKAISIDNSTSIYPNPVVPGRVLNVDSADTVTSVNIFDITGSKVHSGNSSEISINLASGFYLVQINTTKGTSTKKLLVK